MTEKQIEQIRNLFSYKGFNHCEVYPSPCYTSCYFVGPSYCDLVWIDIVSVGDTFNVKWLYRGQKSAFEKTNIKFSDVKKIVKGYQ